MKYLSATVHDAVFQPADLFELKPWNKTKKTDTYGRIKAKTPIFITSSFSNCAVSLRDDLLTEVNVCYFPGGYYIDFSQLTDQSWLVSISAEKILASCYLRLTNDAMMELIRASGIIS